MLNVKQGSCEYQLLKYFGLTRPGNQTQVFSIFYLQYLKIVDVDIVLIKKYGIDNNQYKSIGFVDS